MNHIPIELEFPRFSDCQNQRLPADTNAFCVGQGPAKFHPHSLHYAGSEAWEKEHANSLGNRVMLASSVAGHWTKVVRPVHAERAGRFPGVHPIYHAALRTRTCNSSCCISAHLSWNLEGLNRKLTGGTVFDYHNQAAEPPTRYSLAQHFTVSDLRRRVQLCSGGAAQEGRRRAGKLKHCHCQKGGFQTGHERGHQTGRGN